MSLTARQIEIPSDLTAAIADVRNNGTETDWVLASLSSESEQQLAIRVVGGGTGGISAMRELFTQDNIYYGLVRTTHAVEGELTVNIKFVFVSFIGEGIGVMRKAKLSTLTGDIAKAFDGFHCELKNISSKDEATDEAVQKELNSMFGGVMAAKQVDDGTMRIGQRTVKIGQKGDGDRKKSALSERQNVAMPPALAGAIADVRSDASPTNWCLCGFAPTGLALEMVGPGSGSGGIGELAALLSQDNIFYGLYRTTQVLDEKAPPQVRFVFITYVGEGISVMRKAKISTLRGTIAADFDPFHCELLNVSSQAEVTDEAVTKELATKYGTAIATQAAAADGSSTMRIGQKTVRVEQKTAARKASVMGEKQSVAMPPELAGAIADVRNDATPTDWCLCGFDGSGAAMEMRMVGSGSGGVAALSALLSAEGLYYGLVRTTEAIDASVTVKFVFISFIGESVAPMRKAKVSTLKGTITVAFEPFHAELLNASTKDEATEATVLELLKKSDGRTGAAQATARKETKVVVAKSMAGADAVYTAPEAQETPAPVKAAVAAVRSDGDPAAWCLLGYDDAKAPQLTVVAQGEGAADEMATHLTADALLYALVRVTQTIDASVVVKFALVSWVGEQVAPMRKAKLSSMRGQATGLLSPHHTELLSVSSPGEVTHAAIMEQLAIQGGSTAR